MSLIMAFNVIRAVVFVAKELGLDSPSPTSASNHTSSTKSNSLTYCYDCNKEMTQLHFSGNPTNRYQCSGCWKQIDVTL